MGLQWIGEPRSNVIELRPRINPHHPSVQPALFDQDKPVTIPALQAQLIASLLKSARPHLPSPKACDEAIAILMGERS
jgi:hypothetical protein